MEIEESKEEDINFGKVNFTELQCLRKVLVAPAEEPNVPYSLLLSPIHGVSWDSPTNFFYPSQSSSPAEAMTPLTLAFGCNTCRISSGLVAATSGQQGGSMQSDLSAHCSLPRQRLNAHSPTLLAVLASKNDLSWSRGPCSCFSGKKG